MTPCSDAGGLSWAQPVSVMSTDVARRAQTNQSQAVVGKRILGKAVSATAQGADAHALARISGVE